MSSEADGVGRQVQRLFGAGTAVGDSEWQVTDYGAYAMTHHLSNEIFGHCWHRGDNALIPPPGALAVVLYSKEHGDLLISENGPQIDVHSFTQRRTIYDRR